MDQKFRRRPYIVCAVKVSKVLAVAESAMYHLLPDWLYAQHAQGNISFWGDHLIIHTLEGAMRADYNDWVVCGVVGEIFPVKPAIFVANYEPVE